jgi:RNA polymerase sigma factor (sigma-70 family)
MELGISSTVASGRQRRYPPSRRLGRRWPDRGRDGMSRESRSEFDAVFCDLLPRLYRRAALLVEAATAEDVVHEAYLKLAVRPGRLTAHPHPYAYAFATMVSVVRDDWRRGRRQVPVANVSEDLLGGVDGGLGWREAVWEARRLLDGLAPGEAAAVLLVDLDGYSIDQAADMLGVHRGTVARARGRGLDKLRTRQRVCPERGRRVSEPGAMPATRTRTLPRQRAA